MKRILCLLLSVCMLFSLSTAAFAAGSEMKLTLTTDTSRNTVRAELISEGNPGLCSAQFTLAFNEDVLKCTSCSLGDALSGMMSAENPNAPEGAIIAAASAMPISGDGVFAEFEFEVIGEGNYDLELIDARFTTEDGSRVGYSFKSESGETSGTTSSPGDDESNEEKEPDTVQPETFTGHWAEDYLTEGFARGVLAKVPEGTKPDSEITRADFVASLWHTVGEPEPETKSDFTDIKNLPEERRNAIAWAEENEYIFGRGNNKFDPDSSISRQEVAIILRRVSQGRGEGGMLFNSIYDMYFKDSSDISLWAKDDVYWAVYNDLWCGRGILEISNTLYPSKPATYAEIMVMMVRYQNKFEGGEK